MACPFSAKKFLNELRISFAVIIVIYNLTIYCFFIYCAQNYKIIVNYQLSIVNCFVSLHTKDTNVMALNTNKTLKKYYSIGEVAEMFDVTETLLRYWEKEFPTIQPRKGGRNVRQYTQEDIDEIRVIHNMVKVRGMKLAAARSAITKNRSKESDTTELMNRLQAIRAELLGIKKELDGIA